MKLLCGIRRYGSIYKSLPCILFRACASIQAALIILLRHFTYQAHTVYKDILLGRELAAQTDISEFDVLNPRTLSRFFDPPLFA